MKSSNSGHHHLEDGEAEGERIVTPPHVLMGLDMRYFQHRYATFSLQVAILCRCGTVISVVP